MEIQLPPSLSLESWAKRSFLEQMANIGSEVGRTLNRKRTGQNFDMTLVRALDLFSATVELLVQEKKSARTREVLRAKEQFLAAVFEKDDPGLEKYFHQFAMAVRLKR